VWWALQAVCLFVASYLGGIYNCFAIDTLWETINNPTTVTTCAEVWIYLLDFT
jgi:hypothetical protein